MNLLNSQISPLVSIVMPVKNGGDYIREAIDSLLNQTFSDFELIVINDGSTDTTAEIVRSFEDPRISLVSQENQGVSKASNHGFKLSRGKYITRHDHDDLSLPTRLEKQVQFLEDHPKTDFIGTWAQIWAGGAATGRLHQHPSVPGEVAFYLLFNSPFVHSSCMYRRVVFETTGGYTSNNDRVPPEDYEYFSRISRQYVMANIPEVLVVYREVPNSMSSMLRSDKLDEKEKFIFNLARISSENLAFANKMKGITQVTQDFGNMIHHGLKKEQALEDIKFVKQLITQAAEGMMVRFKEPALAKRLKQRLLMLDYEYATFIGDTYHWSRLQYLFFNRTLNENLSSLGRLFKKIVTLKNSGS